MLKVFYGKFHNTVEDVKENAQRESGDVYLGKIKLRKNSKSSLRKVWTNCTNWRSKDEKKPIFASLSLTNNWKILLSKKF